MSKANREARGLNVLHLILNENEDSGHDKRRMGDK